MYSIVIAVEQILRSQKGVEGVVLTLVYRVNENMIT